MACNNNKCTGKIAPSCPKPTPQGWGDNTFYNGPILGSIRSTDDFNTVIIKLFNMIQGCTAPAVTSQPVSTSVVLGMTFSLTAGFSGTTLAIQWYKDGVAISGATGLTYTVLTSQASDLGSYYAKATNDCGSATTNSVTVAEGTISTFNYGTNTDGSVPTAPTDLQNTGSFTAGVDLSANFTAVVDPAFVIVGVPSTAPVYTKWFVTAGNEGQIDTASGGSNFLYTVVSGSTRYYLSNYPSLIPSNPLILKIS